MAHFYCSIERPGIRAPEVHRVGSKHQTMIVTAASWQGAVKVRIYHDSDTGEDRVVVEKRQWANGAGVNELLYSGPVGKPAERDPQLTLEH